MWFVWGLVFALFSVIFFDNINNVLFQKMGGFGSITQNVKFLGGVEGFDLNANVTCEIKYESLYINKFYITIDRIKGIEVTTAVKLTQHEGNVALGGILFGVVGALGEASAKLKTEQLFLLCTQYETKEGELKTLILGFQKESRARSIAEYINRKVGYKPESVSINYEI